MRRVERFPEALRDHLQRPRNVGEPAGGADLRGEAHNPACGDIVVLFLKLAAGDSAPATRGAPSGTAGAPSGAPGAPPGTAPRPPEAHAVSVVVAAGFQAQGCPAAMASASAACELLPGLPADEHLPEALAARFEAAFGPSRPAHRHALALVREALRERRPPRRPA
jgi:NifU-like protein involved in Fe-S cluster formation